MEPVAYLAAVAVERQRLPVEGVGGEERQDLLRVLVRSVGVRAARDRRVDTERPHAREHLEVTACLRRAVGAGRPERIVLAGRPAGLDVAVDLVGRDLDEASAQLTCDLE